MKKRFVAPALRVEATLTRLTLEVIGVSGERCEGNTCDLLDE